MKAKRNHSSINERAGGRKRKKKKDNGGEDIIELYEKIIETRSHYTGQDEAIFEKVWPFIKEHDESDKTWLKACKLLVSLVVNQEGKPSASFCDDTPKLRKVLLTLFEEEPNEDNTELIQFCGVLLVTKVTKSILLSIITGVDILHFIPSRRLELELKKSASIRRKFSQAGSKPERHWTNKWIQGLLLYIEGFEKETEKKVSSTTMVYLHRSLELLIDLLSAFDSRQYLILYLHSINFVALCKFSLRSTPFKPYRLLHQLLSRVYCLIDFPVGGDKTSLSKSGVVAIYHSRASVVQRMCHRYYADDLQEIIYAGVGLLCNGTFLPRAMTGLPDEKFINLMHRLRLIDKDDCKKDREYLMAILMHHLTPPLYPLDRLKEFPLYPSENILFDHSLIPPGTLLRKSPPLSTPKLQTQFLSYLDYLLRNFELVRVESAYEIRSDLVDVVKRLKPVVRQSMAEESNDFVLRTEFTGWARMALEIENPLKLMRVTAPKLGQNVPAQVVAEFTVDLVHCGDSIRREWDGLGEFDILFLISIDANKMTGAPAPLLSELENQLNIASGVESERRIPDSEDSTFPERFGVTAIRGCMILNIRDENGNIINDFSANESQEDKKDHGTKRIITVELDTAQYARDSRSRQGSDIYQSFNLVVRRHGKENNFRAVLKTIKGLMEGSGSISRVIPSWLQPVVLGYGDPNGAAYTSSVIRSYAMKTPGVAKPDSSLDFGDTFLDTKHLLDSFPEYKVEMRTDEKSLKSVKSERQNFKLEFKEKSVKASSYDFSSEMKGNPVRFTPIQVEAIRSGLSLGLTLIVGPPGTGKSDVAVQIIANLYHSFPNQRTIIITHSNAALNDLFQKIMFRGDIDERYMIRLGAGERELDIDSSHNFSRVGRVSHSLARRAALLEKVQLLSESMGISRKEERDVNGSSSYTCESSRYFNEYYVKKAINKFKCITKSSGDKEVGKYFPFTSFFKLSDDDINKMNMDDAKTKFFSIDQLFAELEEYRPLELLKSQRQRTDYFLMKQAKIVAMTCTHAAIARSRLIKMGFQYDNIVMEEAGQMTEAETFIPLLMQRGETDVDIARLKRICLIGDHHQLPPIVKNISFARFSNLDRSLFARLIEFGVPYIQLNRQGRTRSEIADLFRWRYKNLGDLQYVTDSDEYKVCNAGFVHTNQVINVDDYNGKGETAPTAYYYQNVGEAEYAVALFQFMIMIGYPSEKISILTTYNGQKELIIDILKQRCGEGTLFGGSTPRAVSTVDQYQGQQNDYVILSLVRTSSVGYLRDIRRCVVAMSRARLGLYVLCRQKLFESCHELRPTMEQFSNISNKLQMVLGEHFPATRFVNAGIETEKKFEVSDVSHMGSIVESMKEKMIDTN